MGSDQCTWIGDSLELTKSFDRGNLSTHRMVWEISEVFEKVSRRIGPSRETALDIPRPARKRTKILQIRGRINMSTTEKTWGHTYTRRYWYPDKKPKIESRNRETPRSTQNNKRCYQGETVEEKISAEQGRNVCTESIRRIFRNLRIGRKHAVRMELLDQQMEYGVGWSSGYELGLQTHGCEVVMCGVLHRWSVPNETSPTEQAEPKMQQNTWRIIEACSLAKTQPIKFRFIHVHHRFIQLLYQMHWW